MTCIGLPHSEIPGSKVICTSPRLIAAYHVLHRLLVPRHPPYALCSLTKNLLPEHLRSHVERSNVLAVSFGVNLYSIVKEQKPG